MILMRSHQGRGLRVSRSESLGLLPGLVGPGRGWIEPPFPSSPGLIPALLHHAPGPPSASSAPLTYRNNHYLSLGASWPLPGDRAPLEGDREHHGRARLDTGLLADPPEQVLKIIGRPGADFQDVVGLTFHREAVFHLV